MLRRLVLITATMLLGIQQIASASTLTYDFTGTLDQPLNGTTTINGSFSFNPHPYVQPGMSSVTEGGNDVSLTMHIGSWNLIYVNSLFPDATLKHLSQGDRASQSLRVGL